MSEVNGCDAAEQHVSAAEFDAENEMAEREGKSSWQQVQEWTRSLFLLRFLSLYSLIFWLLTGWILMQICTAMRVLSG